MSHLVVTGANGFVGRAVCRRALEAGHRVTALVRSKGACIDGVREWVHDATDFDGLDAKWPPDLRADVVIHLAARVHVMRDESPDPDAAFDATNVVGTLRLANAARHRGVRRIVYASSIKAVGEKDDGVPLSEVTPPAPQDAYGRSKLRAERQLAQFGKSAGLEVVVVRPPLVYGPAVRANFLRMMDAVARGCRSPSVPSPHAAALSTSTTWPTLCCDAQRIRVRQANASTSPMTTRHRSPACYEWSATRFASQCV